MNPLYNKSLEELNKMARDKGINFSVDYRGPYTYDKELISPEVYYKTCDPIDWDRKILDIPEENYHKKIITIYNIRCAGNHFRCARLKENAIKFTEEMNKRHFIVAMQSENPKYPVLL